VEKDLSDVVKLLGRRSALVANLRESLLSLSRMLQYFLNNAATWMRGDLAAQFRSVMRDIKSLDDYTNQQTQEMTFLLESTLGLINIQQNQIIKIFTVASVLFMPPTLIASIYGMNVGLPAARIVWAFPGHGDVRPPSSISPPSCVRSSYHASSASRAAYCTCKRRLWQGCHGRPYRRAMS
jgi:magnesium transporter